MVNRVQDVDNKKKPIASFAINVPLIFTISGSKKLINEFDEIYPGKKSHFFKRNFLNIFNVQYDSGILKDKEVLKKAKELKLMILNQSGIEPSEHSKFQCEKMEEYIKNKSREKRDDENKKE